MLCSTKCVCEYVCISVIIRLLVAISLVLEVLEIKVQKTKQI